MHVFAVHVKYMYIMVFAQDNPSIRSTGLHLAAQGSEPPIVASRGLSQL